MKVTSHIKHLIGWRQSLDGSLRKKLFFNAADARRDRAGILESGVVFIHLPKCAGISVTRALYGFEIGHKPLWYFERLLGPSINDVRIVFVYRDPVDRFASALRFLSGGGMAHYSDDAFIGGKLAGKSPDEILKDSRLMGYVHFLPMTYFLDGIQRYPASQVSAIPIENMDSGFAAIGRPLNIRHLNRTPDHSGQPLPTQWQEPVRQHYRDDYDLLKRILAGL